MWYQNSLTSWPDFHVTSSIIKIVLFGSKWANRTMHFKAQITVDPSCWVLYPCWGGHISIPGLSCKKEFTVSLKDVFTDFTFLALLSNVSVLCLDPKMPDQRKDIQKVPVFIWHSRMNTCCVDKGDVLQVFTSHSERSVFFIIYVSLHRL